MFPAALASADSDLSKEVARSLVVVDRSAPRGGTWLKPATLTELLGLLREYEGGCKLVVGNTEVGIGEFALDTYSSARGIIVSDLTQNSISF